MTPEQKKKIAWLNRAFHAEKAAKAWLSKLERDRSLAERITRSASESAQNASGGAAGNTTEDYLIRLADTQERVQEALRALVEIRDEITRAIENVDDPDMQAILVRHYLAYETWEMVAEKMYYSVRCVKYKHKKALDQLCIVLHSDLC